MGTSSDRDGGRGGAWTSLKRAATDYAKSSGTGGGTDAQAQRLIARHVAVLGGAGVAAGSAVGGKTALNSLGGFFSDFATGGLVQVLQRLGLGHLVGSDRFDVLDELVSALAGDGGDLESQAARDAQCDVLDAFFGDATDWVELAAVPITPQGVLDLLTDFLARYLFNRIPSIGERLARIMDPAAVRRADQRILDMIRGLVDLKLPPNALTDFDWKGPDGRAFSEERIAEIYRIVESFGDEDL
jgi:hypothetical protein